MLSQEKHAAGKGQGDGSHDDGPGLKHFFRPAGIAGADVLGHDGGDAGGEVDDGQKNDSVHPVGSGNGGHGLGAEGVHEALQINISNGADAGLYRGRKAEAEIFSQDRGTESGL